MTDHPFDDGEHDLYDFDEEELEEELDDEDEEYEEELETDVYLAAEEDNYGDDYDEYDDYN